MQTFKREQVFTYATDLKDARPDFIGTVQLGESFVIETENSNDVNGPIAIAGIKAGDALIHTLGDEVDYHQWLAYATTLGIERKYPGINGIGIIHALDQADLPAYLAAQRAIHPSYQIHPEHSRTEYYPITYIEPFKSNKKAVGLDMAHETNRFTAAKKARDTGEAQITGPITLVQDAEKRLRSYIPFNIKIVHHSLILKA
jgi:CHASE1-domain containing sensor protein